MNRIDFENELRAQGYRVVNSSLKPNMVDPDHTHDFDARLFVLGGDLTLMVHGTTKTLKAGDRCEVTVG